MRRRLPFLLGLLVLAGVLAAATFALGGTPTTGTATACATATAAGTTSADRTVPGHTVAVDGANVSTVPPVTVPGVTVPDAVASQCSTVTYTVPTETTTVTTTAPTTTTAPPTTTVPTTTTTPPTTAQVYLSPTGNDANPCTQASPCKSLQRGYTLAQPGQTVSVAAGQYPGQSISGTKAAPGVTFQLDPAAVIGDISGSGQLNIHATNLTFVGGQIPAAVFQGAVSTNVTFKNVDGGRMWIDNASSYISWVGGDLGPNQCSGGTATYLNTIMNGSHVTFDGVRFHDQKICSSGEHTESLRIDQGSSYVTVTNSTFQANDDSTSAIFITTQQAATGMPHDISITGNDFQASGTNKMIWTQDPNVTVCTNYTITGNRYKTPAAFATLNCPTQTNVVVANNTGY